MSTSLSTAVNASSSSPAQQQPAQQLAAAFPPSFLFGFATASAQIESGADEGGRGPSIWDAFCKQPGAIVDGTSVADTCDHYRLFKEDIALMKSLGVNAYRFSISWSRIIPLGGKDDALNEEGVAFYSDLIDECLRQGITPFATLYHWDLPLALYERYGGWTSRESLADFERYASVCFERFGDRVKHWLTFNEPWCVAVLGHSSGVFAPGVKSATEPWIVGHHLILAHARAARLYQNSFQAAQEGTIGITLNGDWAVPYDDSPENVKAVQDKLDASIGWFADPIYLGHYPQSMVNRLGDRLPQFTPKEIALVHGSSEFYGMNTYTTNTVRAGGQDEPNGNALLGFDRPDGTTALGTQSEEPWLQDVPWGFRALLKYLADRYRKPIYVTENGFAVKGESKLSKEAALRDTDRVKFYEGYLSALRDAVVIDKVDVRSYFGWSLIDNFEWRSGLTTRFGSVYVDFKTKERTPKDSATVIAQFFRAHGGAQA